MLSQLAKDEETMVRRNVAENPKTPQETLSGLTRDEAVNVRYGTCLNERTPLADIIRLAKTDETQYVRNVALDALAERATRKETPSPQETLQASAAKVRQNEGEEDVKETGPTNPDC